jgi:Spy/CpxP family protein refolding chaperone
MLKKSICGMLLVVIFLLPATAPGQDVPAGKWWRNSKIVKELNLTQQEVGALDQLYAQSRRKLIELKNNVEREQFELDNLLGSKNAEDAEVKRQFKKLETARSDLSNERFRFVMQIRDIIGHDRFEQLKTSYKKWK